MKVKGQLEDAQLHNKTSDPSVGQTGRIWVRTDTNKAKFDDGAAVREVVTLDQTQTLTNKTIAAGSNTVSGLTNTNLSGSAAITNANHATMAANTVKGNNTGVAATPLDLTATQATAMLNAMVGDSGSGGTKGLVPAPSAGDAASSKFLKADGTFSVVSASVPLLSLSSKTTAYTALTSDDMILASGSAFTISLYTAVGNTGRQIRIKKTDSSTSNIITIDPNSAETIDGSLTTTLNTQYEQVALVSDGANWQLLVRDYPQSWVAYTPTFVGLGTPTGITAYSRRVGDTLEVTGSATSGTTTATAMQISIGYNGTNANVTANTSKIAGTNVIGNMTVAGQSTTVFGWYIIAPASNQTYVNASVQQSTSNATTAQNGNSMIGTAQLFEFEFKIPIVGWN